MVRAMCGVRVKDRTCVSYLMLMLGFRETMISWLWQEVFVGMDVC